VREWYCRHSFAVDVAIAVAFALLDTGTTLAGVSWWPRHPGTLAWAMLGVQAAACLSLVVRRRAPLLVIGVLAAFTLAVTLLISPAGALVPAHPDNTVWAPYSTTLAAYGPLYYGLHHRPSRRTGWIALAMLTLVVARPWQPSGTVITIGVLRVAVGPLLALYFSARQRLVQVLTERAERAERERHLLAEQARAEERARLAGEMHDVVTHRVSLMVLQAGALRMTATDEATRQAAEELRAAGCQALDELRDLVGILHTAPDAVHSTTGDDEPVSTPGFAALIAESTAVGTPAELVEDGDPALASPVVGRTVYRVVREALTNVRKHAPGARVIVRVSYDPSQVRLEVRNTPPAGPASPAQAGLAGTGSGLGIAGLRQRIELVHGTLRAAPTPDGGFSVGATLPAYVPTAEPWGELEASNAPGSERETGRYK
jgi:signal transduction histidine kinase